MILLDTRWGDRYIESFSAILAGVQNERISAYRIGGDEFCVILEKTNVVEIHRILDSLERKVNVYNEKLTKFLIIFS